MEEATLRSIGVSDEEMDTYMNSLKTGIGNEDNHVCICGHLMRRHESNEAGICCNVSRSWCDCSAPLPVIEPDRVKPFQFASTGHGKRHALTKGLYALRKEGYKARWLIEIACFKCKTTNQPIHPAPLNRSGRVTNAPGHRNVMLCQPCIDEIGGVFYY